MPRSELAPLLALLLRVNRKLSRRLLGFEVAIVAEVCRLRAGARNGQT